MNNQLAAAIYNADEERLIAIANKGIYKRAVKDAESAEADIAEYEASAEVSVGGEKCVITFPLEESRCSCPSRTVCRHIITAVLLLKKRIPEQWAAVEEDVKYEEEKPAEVHEIVEEKFVGNKFSETEQKKIQSCAEMCMGLLCGVLKHGLVRIPETAAEDFELAAVRCHGAKMAECERLMRSLGGRIADFTARRASFDIRLFTRRLMETAEHLEHLLSDEITSDDLGSFRSVYTDIKGELEIIPVGQRTVSGGEYAGEIFYFVNCDPNDGYRFLTFSDIRPVFYETGKKRPQAACPWGMGTPLRSMMKRRMKLVGAKVCEGRLSASKETIVIDSTSAVLDCSLIHSLMVTDFREIALRLAECSSDRETDRLFFIYPRRMLRYGFDKNEQQLVITFEDHNGCTADCTVKYRIESKVFIEQLERICKKMSEPSEKVYTLLITAYIKDGELCFFPIEVYDFIRPSELHTFSLSEKAELLAEEGELAEETGRFIAAVGDILVRIVQTGLQSEHDWKFLIAESRSMGMEGLAELISKTAAAADSCRHSIKDGSRRALDNMIKLNRYIIAAEKRTGSVSALNKLYKGE
ncbi:MAG: hypothetical protein GXY08_09225 [Ruminococcus sp.]|nr:hypothetical protein [Ruminococcus sp.]